MWFTPKEAFRVVDLIGFLLRRTSLLQLEDHQCVTPLMRSQVEEREEQEELYFRHRGTLWNPDPLQDWRWQSTASSSQIERCTCHTLRSRWQGWSFTLTSDGHSLSLLSVFFSTSLFSPRRCSLSLLAGETTLHCTVYDRYGLRSGAGTRQPLYGSLRLTR